MKQLEIRQQLINVIDKNDTNALLKLGGIGLDNNSNANNQNNNPPQNYYNNQQYYPNFVPNNQQLFYNN